MKTRHLSLSVSLCVSLSIPLLILPARVAVAAELPYGLMDPTRPLEYTVPSTQQHLQSDLVLTSVLINGEIKIAVINGERLMEGQLVDGARIISIQPGRAILRKGNRNRELKVHQSNVRQLARESSTRRSNL